MSLLEAVNLKISSRGSTKSRVCVLENSGNQFWVIYKGRRLSWSELVNEY